MVNLDSVRTSVLSTPARRSTMSNFRLLSSSQHGWPHYPSKRPEAPVKAAGESADGVLKLFAVSMPSMRSPAHGWRNGYQPEVKGSNYSKKTG
jgi:hypothetical protein